MNRSELALILAGTLFLIFPLFQQSGPDPAAMLEASHLTDSNPPDQVECTTGVVSSGASANGRPLLWKNRDLGGGFNQEFHYIDDGRIPFISVTYSGVVNQHYGGVNAVGFAVENSNSYNLGPVPNSNGWGSGDDDGFIQHLALATCRTVDDFQELLDSSNAAGRRLNSNYGAIDAFGGAAIFETSGFWYSRCDAVDAPGGWLVRSNYSYAGGDSTRNYDWGPNRHDTAFRLFKRGEIEGNLTAEYILQTVARNLYHFELDPYPLPYEGYSGNLPYGCISNAETVGRFTTRSVLVVEGVPAGGNPDEAVLWAVCGSPLSAIATPLWVRAGNVPVEVDGFNNSRICDRAIDIREYLYVSNQFGQGLSTWRLSNPWGTGAWDYLLPLERWVFRKTHQFLRSPNFSADLLETFQREMAEQVADSLEAWRPYRPVNEVTTIVGLDGRIYLMWGEFEEDVIGPCDSYEIRRSSEPFREESQGELAAVTSDTSWIDASPSDEQAFYRVIRR
jgi:hypothetical protein